MLQIPRIALCTLLLACGPVARAAQTGLAGGAQPVSNMQPALGMNYIIRLTGTSAQLGEVVPFAGSFAPAGWAFTQGQLLTVNGNEDLFQRLGDVYGGNGSTTFALPDTRGRTIVHRGAGTGLTDRPLGTQFGVESSNLTMANIPAHDHTLPGGGATGLAGGPLTPFTNMQPSLAMNYAVSLFGNFPSEGVAMAPPWYGQVRLFAGNMPPAGYASADGQLLPISTNTSLFAILGTRYGGNGVVTFALPDLRGRTVIHDGSPPASDYPLGTKVGAETVALALNQLAPHTHSLPEPADMTNATGGGQPFENRQPSLALNYIICTQGNFPSPGMGAAEPFLGQVALFAGGFAPRNWMFANGQTLPISTNTSLFAILGTTYGGNGVTTFNLPDLRGGRAIVGAGDAPGLSEVLAGQVFGAAPSALTAANLPLHQHTFTQFNADFDGDNDIDGADLLIWQRGVGATMGATHAQGDANFDGDVDDFDLAVWRTQFGNPPPPPAAPAPEPAAAVMTLLAAIALLARRRRR